MLTRALMIFVALTLLACSPQGSASRVPFSTTLNIAQFGTQLSLLRAGEGVSEPIIQNPALQAAAQYHADDLAATGRFDHTGSDGSTVASRVRAAGYDACRVSENIARGQSTPSQVITTWRGSPDHYANIIDPGVAQFGVARSGDVWVLVLARPCA